MRFYYCNSSGDEGVFSDKDLIKAIYSVWNIEGDLYIIPPKTTMKNILSVKWDWVFSSLEDNEVNNELLEKYGYYMIDGDEYREIRRISNNGIVHYDWSDVLKLN